RWTWPSDWPTIASGSAWAADRRSSAAGRPVPTTALVTLSSSSLRLLRRNGSVLDGHVREDDGLHGRGVVRADEESRVDRGAAEGDLDRAGLLERLAFVARPEAEDVAAALEPDPCGAEHGEPDGARDVAGGLAELEVGESVA